MGDIVTDINKILNYNVNNLWLGGTVEEVIIDPTTGPEDDTLTLAMRTMGITFETIYKNIASYPSTLDTTQENKIIKTFYLENDKSITITTDISTDGNVIETLLSGDTELPYPIKRTKTLYNDIIKTIYHEVK